VERRRRFLHTLEDTFFKMQKSGAEKIKNHPLTSLKGKILSVENKQRKVPTSSSPSHEKGAERERRIDHGLRLIGPLARKRRVLGKGGESFRDHPSSDLSRTGRGGKRAQLPLS